MECCDPSAPNDEEALGSKFDTSLEVNLLDALCRNRPTDFLPIPSHHPAFILVIATSIIN